MGEFGYVLAGIGLAAGAVSAEMFTAVLSTIVVTIAGSAVLVRFFGKAPTRAETQISGAETPIPGQAPPVGEG
jgi:hypothetical protein